MKDFLTRKILTYVCIFIMEPLPAQVALDRLLSSAQPHHGAGAGARGSRARDIRERTRARRERARARRMRAQARRERDGARALTLWQHLQAQYSLYLVNSLVVLEIFLDIFSSIL